MGNRSLRKCQMPASLVAYSSFYTHVIRFRAPLLWRDGKGNSKGRCVLFFLSFPCGSPRLSLSNKNCSPPILALLPPPAPTTSPCPIADLPPSIIPSKGVRGKFGSPGLAVQNPAPYPLPQTLAPGWQDIAARALLFICIKQ